MSKKETYSIFLPVLEIKVTSRSYKEADKRAKEWVENLPKEKREELEKLTDFNATMIAKKGENEYLVTFPYYALDVEAENEKEIIEKFVEWIKSLSPEEKEKMRELLNLNKIIVMDEKGGSFDIEFFRNPMDVDDEVDWRILRKIE